LLLFDRVFTELFGTILTHNFLGTEVALKLFFICSLEMVVGPLCKCSRPTYTLQLLLGVPLKGRYLHIQFL